MSEIVEVLGALLIGLAIGAMMRRRGRHRGGAKAARTSAETAGGTSARTSTATSGADRIPRTIGRDFLQVLYHELRSPCSSVAALARACGRLDEVDPATRAEALDLIRRHAEHLNAILDDVREVADSLNTACAAGSCGVHEVIRTSAACAGLPAHLLNVDVARDAAVVAVPGSALSRLLINLLQNAIRYGPTDASVHVSSRHCSAALVEVVVRDAGEGPGGASDRSCPEALGLGSRIVDELTAAIGGEVVRRVTPQGYEVALRLPDRVADVLPESGRTGRRSSMRQSSPSATAAGRVSSERTSGARGFGWVGPERPVADP